MFFIAQQFPHVRVEIIIIRRGFGRFWLASFPNLCIN
jgi:hypothetical protein